MKRRTATIVLVAGVIGAVAAGSGLTAWANWSVGTTSGVAIARGETLPTVGKTEAALDGAVPKVEWKAVKFSSGQAVGGYAVTRHVGSVLAEVCRVPATTLTCSDATAEAGTAVTYTVRAVAGDRWAGPASPISEILIVPGVSVPNLAARTPVPSPDTTKGTAGTGTSASGSPGIAPTEAGAVTGGIGTGSGDPGIGSGQKPTGDSSGPGMGATPSANADPKPDTESAPQSPSPTVTAGEGTGADQAK